MNLDSWEFLKIVQNHTAVWNWIFEGKKLWYEKYRPIYGQNITFCLHKLSFSIGTRGYREYMDISIKHLNWFLIIFLTGFNAITLWNWSMCYLLKSYLGFSGNLVRLCSNLIIFNFNFFLIKKEVIGPFLFFVFFTMNLI